jgi:hypothetical protein
MGFKKFVFLGGFVSVIAVAVMVYLLNSNIFLQKRPLTNDNSPDSTTSNRSQRQQTIDDYYSILIRERLKRIGLSELKNEILPRNATEIRFWVGFSPSGLRGLIIKNDGTTWQANFIPNITENTPPSNTLRSLASPTHGWQNLTDQLQQLGLYNLPGESGKIPENKYVLDLTAAVVEIRTSDSYKSIRYRGIFYFRDEDILKMEKILETISSEFSIKLW